LWLQSPHLLNVWSQCFSITHYEDGTANSTSANVKYGFKALSKTGGNSGGNVNTVWVEAAKYKTQESCYMN
jgi:hypothetical protein